MMTLADIKKKCQKIMKEYYPTTKYKYYSNAVVESFIRPCFFTEITIDQSDTASFGAEHFMGTFSIEILQDVIDEAGALEIATTLKKAFGRYFMVKLSDNTDERTVRVKGFDFDFVGTENNVPVITVDLEWYDCITDTVDADPMEDVDVSIIVEAED